MKSGLCVYILVASAYIATQVLLKNVAVEKTCTLLSSPLSVSICYPSPEITLEKNYKGKLWVLDMSLRYTVFEMTKTTVNRPTLNADSQSVDSGSRELAIELVTTERACSQAKHPASTKARF